MKVHLTSFGMPRRDGAASHDSCAVESWDETVIAVLADGAGSAAAAGEASRRIVQSLVSNYQTRPCAWAPSKALGEFTRLINHTLHQDSLARFGAPELISTLSVAVIEGDRLYGLNVGDSRVYLARNGVLCQLSQDHVAAHPGLDHVLDRAMGLNLEVQPHLFDTALSDGDMALLCSDGISNILDDQSLSTQLKRRSTARAIVQSARHQATPETLDDMSAIVLDIEKVGTLQAVKELPLQIPDALRSGMKIDGFTLLKSIQPSDRVWRADHNGSQVIVKFAPLEARENEEILKLFVHETWNAERLSDTGLFPRAFIPENATARLYAMEFIAAENLKKVLSERVLNLDEAIGLGRFLLNAVQCLLRFDLVHGDIKPENIMFIDNGAQTSFKLVDFGSITELFSITSRAGTASYLAPERFHDTPISERTEIFAIGVTIFKALTGAFPYGEIERFQNPHFGAPKKPVALNPHLPAWLESVLLRAISADPVRRYQNYSEMLFDLDHPDKIAPYREPTPYATPERVVRFYIAGFYILLIVCLYLIAHLWGAL